MFAGLINQTDPVRLSNEFDRFVAAIPEFRIKPESALALKAALAAVLMGEAQPEQPQAETEGNIAEQENETNNVDTAGPAEEQEQPGTNNAADMDQPEGPPVSGQPSENDNAPAHVEQYG